MRFSVKRVSSLLPEAKQTIPEEGSGSHCTTCDITLHISLHIAFQWCTRLDQAEDIPNPLPQLAAKHGFISIIDSAPSEEQEDHAQPDDVMRVRVCF